MRFSPTSMLLLICLSAGAARAVPAAAQEAGNRPSVLFILADDLGWRDTSAYGSTFYKIPNIDALIARGVRFTNAYSASLLCSPTRASILTGLHPARLGITAPRAHHPVEVSQQGLLPGKPHAPWREADSVTRLDTAYYTLAEAFADAGHRTGHFGKWHLGREPYTPLQPGYQVDVPHWYGPATQEFRDDVTASGWNVHKHAYASVQGGTLVLDCFGIDPYLVNDDVPAQAGEMNVSYCYRSTAGPVGQLYWKTRDNDDFRQQKIDHPLQNDGAWHEVDVPFRAGSPLTVLRFDPTNNKGEVDVQWLRLSSRDRKLLKE